MSGESFPCYLVERIDGTLRHSIATRTLAELPSGEVTIAVEYSSLNYKDALAATAHPGVVRKLPHIPGIDAAGKVLTSTDPRFKPGDQVIATSYEIGAERWGGWSHVDHGSDATGNGGTYRGDWRSHAGRARHTS